MITTVCNKHFHCSDCPVKYYRLNFIAETLLGAQSLVLRNLYLSQGDFQGGRNCKQYVKADKGMDVSSP